MARYCDLCGREITGEPITVVVDRATLQVCRSCAQRLSMQKVNVVPPGQVTQAPQRRPQVVRVSTSSGQRKRKLPELRYEVVEDYPRRIREARERLGFTRELLARLVGEKESVIRRIEEGTLEPTVELARKLEKVLKIKLLVPASEVVEDLELEYESERPELEELTLGDIVEIRERKKKRGET